MILILKLPLDMVKMYLHTEVPSYIYQFKNYSLNRLTDLSEIITGWELCMVPHCMVGERVGPCMAPVYGAMLYGSLLYGDPLPHLCTDACENIISLILRNAVGNNSFISSIHHQLLPATWLWIWLQSRSYACPRCETPHRLQLKFHLMVVARYVYQFLKGKYISFRFRAIRSNFGVPQMYHYVGQRHSEFVGSTIQDIILSI